MRAKKAKKSEIIIERWGERLSLPRPKDTTIWFNTSYGLRGHYAESCVVSPSIFSTLSKETFRKICALSSQKQLARLDEFLGDGKKGQAFRAIIREFTDTFVKCKGCGLLLERNFATRELEGHLGSCKEAK